MKSLAFYALAAALYVVGGVFMKYSRGLTRLLPTLALMIAFSTGALIQAWAMRHQQLGPSYVVVLGLEAIIALAAGHLLFHEAITVKIFTGVVLVVMGIMVLRLV
jgi:small multidrug resistance pump